MVNSPSRVQVGCRVFQNTPNSCSQIQVVVIEKSFELLCGISLIVREAFKFYCIGREVIRLDHVLEGVFESGQVCDVLRSQKILLHLNVLCLMVKISLSIFYPHNVQNLARHFVAICVGRKESPKLAANSLHMIHLWFERIVYYIPTNFCEVVQCRSNPIIGNGALHAEGVAVSERHTSCKAFVPVVELLSRIAFVAYLARKGSDGIRLIFIESCLVQKLLVLRRELAGLVKSVAQKLIFLQLFSVKHYREFYVVKS